MSQGHKRTGRHKPKFRRTPALSRRRNRPRVPASSRMVACMVRAGGVCEAQVPEVCTTRGGLTVRPKWPGAESADDFLLVCRECSSWADTHPYQAGVLGLIERRPAK